MNFPLKTTIPPEANGQAISYLRWSSEQQSLGDSLRRQLELSEQYCEQTGLVLNRSLRDEGVSAFNKDNLKGAFGTFIDAVRDGTIPTGTTLIVESLDRLSRAAPIDALQVFLEILKSGILIITLTDRQIYTQRSVTEDWSKLIISIVIMQRAHEESSMKSKRVGAAWANKKKQTIESGKLLTRKVPYWLQVVDGKIELIEERAATVKYMFELAKQGVGSQSIVRLLNSTTQAWVKTGGWQTSYVEKIFHNSAVYGAITLDGVEVEDYFPALMTKAEWHQIVSLRSARRTGGKIGNSTGKTVSNLFSGLVKCAFCGHSMTQAGYVETRYGKHKQSKHLVCSGAKTGRTECLCIRWEYENFESTFLLFAGQLDISAIFGAKQSTRIAEINKQLSDLSLTIDNNKKKIANLYVALEEAPLAGLVKRLQALEIETADLEKKSADAAKQLDNEKDAERRSGSTVKQLLKYYAKMKNCTTDDERRIIREILYNQIHLIVDRIDVFPSGPALNRQTTHLRKMQVTFKSGVQREFSIA